MAKRAPRPTVGRAPVAPSKRRMPRRVTHVGLGILGLVLLGIYFGGMIVRGSAPRAPDSVASVALLKMSQVWALEHHEMPLWTPAVFSGMPSYGSMIYTGEDPVRNLGWRLFIFFAIGGAALYALLIRYGRSPLAAFFVAAVYVFTPYFTGLINAGHNNKLSAAALLPVLLLATDGLLRRRSLKALAWFVLAAACELSGGLVRALTWFVLGVPVALSGGPLPGVAHPQVTYYAFMLIGCIVIADTLVQADSWRARARRFAIDAGLLGAGLVITLGVVAQSYLPVMRYTPLSVRGGSTSAANEIVQQAGEPGYDRGWDWATQWSMHPKELVTFAVPSFYGLWNDPRYNQPQDLDAYAHGNTYWGYMPFTQSTYYFGLIPLLLALLVRPNRHGLVWGCIAFSVVALFIGMGKWLPVLYWPAYHLLPYFSKFRVPSMIYMVLPLSVGIVGAWALDLLTTAEPSPGRPTAGSPARHPMAGPRFPREEHIALVAGGAALALALGVLVFHGDWGWMTRAEERLYPPQILRALTALRGRMAANDALIAALLAIATAGGVMLVSRRKLRPLLVGVVLVAATVADLWRLDFNFLSALPPTYAEVQPARPAAVDVIRQDVAQQAAAGTDTLFRIAPVAGADQSGDFVLESTNEYGLWGLQSVSGYHAAKLRIYDDLMVAGGLSHRNVLDMLNARYLIGPPGMADSTLLPLDEGPQVVYRNEAALPRAWWVGSVRSVPNEPAVLRATIDPSFKPADEAIVLASDRIGTVGSKPATPPRVTSWDFQRVVISARTDRPAYLVVSEVYVPEGWKATIDGQPTRIHQTDYVLRGIVVPPGDHTVVLTYTSSAYRIGRVLSWSLFALVILVLVEETWRTRRRAAPPTEQAS